MMTDCGALFIYEQGQMQNRAIIARAHLRESSKGSNIQLSAEINQTGENVSVSRTILKF